MKTFATMTTIGVLVFAQAASASPAVDTLLDGYRAAGAGPFSAEAGQRMWREKHNNGRNLADRSCNVCHTDDLKDHGKHVKTRKLIKPMAPSINAERLTEVKKIEKWFKRNCKWTLGRECTAQEKGDFLVYIQN
ncbi:MAG: DUF1924 domain-containing protein [Gammaproteobacteria bacterium]|nr:DUF1924 domain-containing protein [Gammaproteobacteria bacterium]MCW8922807.1 DUF1924 domain-containing protein [Gammaproteobacteria bacterium]